MSPSKPDVGDLGSLGLSLNTESAAAFDIYLSIDTMNNKKSEFDHSLGKLIREAREQARVTQDQLAEAVRLSRTSITNIERGRQGVQVSLLVRIARTLGKNVADLIPDDDAQITRSLPEQLGMSDKRRLEWVVRVLGVESKEESDGS